MVSSGAAYISAKEALPEASFLKLGMVHRLPLAAIRAFAGTVERLFVVEELEPYVEEQILAAGVAVEGKRWFSPLGELTPQRVGRAFVAAGLDLPRWAVERAAEDEGVIPRPPVLCAGCPHRGMATAMKKLDLDVHGDIGCYDLTSLPPVAHMHSAVEMGASITMEQGFSRGGSVRSHIRIGMRVVAPSISAGEVDYLLAFEAAEGLRLAPSLVEGSVAIVNTQRIVPPLASTDTHTYPYDAVERMKGRPFTAIPVDGNAIAGEVGGVKVAGVVLVGALSTHLSFAVETWERPLARNVPPTWLEMNLAALAAGRKAGGAA